LEHFALTSTQLTALARRIYAIGIPKEDDFLTILMLNAMSKDIPHMHNHVADAIAISTPSAPYGPTNIRSCLELEQQLVDNDKGKGPGNIAMMASNKGKPNQSRNTQATCTDCSQFTHTNCCTTCGGWWHSAKDCYGKGGAMECKKDEVITCCHAAHSNGNTTRTPGMSSSHPTKGVSTGKPGGLQYNTSGHAYLLDTKTHKAIFIASALPPPTPDPNTLTQEFTGLAYDVPSSAPIKELPEDAYDALFTAVDLQASIDWHTHTQPVNFASLTYKAPNQCAHTPLTCLLFPSSLTVVPLCTSVMLSRTSIPYVLYLLVLSTVLATHQFRLLVLAPFT
jgi:hypothetical protein